METNITFLCSMIAALFIGYIFGKNDSNRNKTLA